MIRDYATVAIGMITLLVASAAVYGILTVNTQIQAKPDQTKVPDYSNELNSLKSQINSINSQIGSMSSQLGSMGNNLSTLDSMKNSLTDVRAKLIELEKNSNQVQVSSTGQLSVILDKSVYLPGDTIKIAAVGAVPLKTIQVELVDRGGYVVLNSQTWADSAGKVSSSLQISNSQLSGNYQVKLVSDQQTASTPIIVQSLDTSSTSNSYTFTAQTDKGIYNSNDLVEVSGTGQPNTAVTGVFTSASGKTATSGGAVNADGTYTMFFKIIPSYETGTWTITLTNAGQTKSLSIYIEPGSSSSSYTFTAQTTKTTYYAGDTIQVSGTGQPNTAVTGVLVSPTGKTYDSGSTVNSNGSYTVYFTNLQYYEIGTWYVNLNNGGQSKIITFYMQSAGSSGSYTFTAQTTQSTYTRGALIQVTGTGQPSTIVNGVLTSPSGTAYSASITAQSDGTYAIFFQTSSSYQTGTWSITLTNSAQSKTLYILMQ